MPIYRVNHIFHKSRPWIPATTARTTKSKGRRRSGGIWGYSSSLSADQDNLLLRNT